MTQRLGGDVGRKPILTHHVLVGHSDAIQSVAHQRIRLVGILDDQPE